jgi:hypothetical protein
VLHSADQEPEFVVAEIDSHRLNYPVIQAAVIG